MAWDSYTPTAGTAAPAGGASAAVSYALDQVGKGYRLGATGPEQFDCSGLTMRAFQTLGVTLPHYSTAQAFDPRGVSVDAADPSAWQPGDLLFPHPGHVAIYVGGGQCVEAMNPRDGVRQNPAQSSYWRVRRIMTGNGGTGGITLAQLLAGERAQESGGNYQDVNASSGALGAYQVMPANLSAWSKAALGHTDTRAQFLASPADQDKVAAHVLGGYFDKYGAAGAAAAWYSGNPNLAGDTAPQPGGPSVASYVQSVLGHAAGASPAGAAVENTGLLSSAAGSAAGAVWGAMKPTVVTLAFASVGFALVVVGAAVAAKPFTQQVQGEAVKAAKLAALA